MQTSILLAAQSLRQAVCRPVTEQRVDWLAILQDALAVTETALGARPPTVRRILSPVDDPVQPVSPGLVRNVENLRQSHYAMREQIKRLQSVSAEPWVDVESLRQEGTKLARQLTEYTHVECDLVLESINRETGGGD